MTLPEKEVDVLVKLDNGKFAVAQYYVNEEGDGKWQAGDGVYASYEAGSDILSGKVVGWSALPEVLENQLNSTTKNKPRLK